MVSVSLGLAETCVHQSLAEEVVGEVRRLDVCIRVWELWDSLHLGTSYLQFLLLFSFILINWVLGDLYACVMERCS